MKHDGLDIVPTTTWFLNALEEVLRTYLISEYQNKAGTMVWHQKKC